jgi:hypothetical protein
MYVYALEQWIAEAVTATWIQNLVTEKWLTSEQATTILATPQTGSFG